MAQRPKFKVPNYGMGRRSSVIAVLQKLKPCIYEKYASFLGDKKDDENSKEAEKFTLTENAAKAQKQQPETSPKLMTAKFDPAKSIWQSRVKQGSPQRLPTIPEVKEVPKEFKETANQLPKKMKSIFTDEELKLLLPISRYIDDKLRHLGDAIKADGIWENVIIEKQNIRPQFVVALPEPRFAWRIEIDLITNPTAIYLISSGIFWKETMQHANPNSIMMRAIEQTLYPMDDNLNDRKLTNNHEGILNTLTSYLTDIQTFWKRDTNQFMKIVVTYFVILCLVGFLFTIYI
ncbi:uncharacterized protein [Drosophila virilis]|uniref:Uncharacterized protein, isoform B n=1 Tax=Drosophila virilis TaxID=7244 RepID=B4M1L0_DROVI|nr:uncharacterized protein LOC6631644 isoform X1 [Drosophila virilis]EDW65564.2 uncharacterized protein Dvir_GJ19326, isoform B [Drosophila virilis]